MLEIPEHRESRFSLSVYLTLLTLDLQCSDFRTLMPRQIKHDMKNIMLVNDFSI